MELYAEHYSSMYGILHILFTILLAANKKRKMSKCFVVIFIFKLLNFVSEKDLPYYAFETNLELNQTESLRFTQFITEYVIAEYVENSL